MYFKNGIKYFGSIENGYLHGKGTMEFPNGVKFTGNFIHNKIEGKGKLEYTEHEYFEGELREFKRWGPGTYVDTVKGVKYLGEWKDDQFDGEGQLTIDNQWEYKGGFKDGLKDGKGMVRYFKSENTYEGEFKDNKKTGEGTMIWKTESQFYKGGWNNDKMQGTGYYIYMSELGTKKNIRNFYIGGFEENNRQGFGLHFYSDGSCYVGNWNNGVKDGKALYIDDLGYYNIKIFDNNHLKETKRLPVAYVCDYTVPRIAFDEVNRSEYWTEKDLENVIKTYCTGLRSHYDSLIGSKEPVNEICKLWQLNDIIRFCNKIRVYEDNLSPYTLKYFIRLHKSTFASFCFNHQDLTEIEDRVGHFLSGEIKTFTLKSVCDDDILFTFNNFLNTIMLIMQYKFQGSVNIESTIRDFMKNRMMKIITQEIIIKEWVKDEKSILAIYKKYHKANEQMFEKMYKSLLSETKTKVLKLRDLLRLMERFKVVEMDDKSHILLFLRVVERHTDPFKTLYNKYKTNIKGLELHTVPQFVSLLNIQLTYTEFVDNMFLILHVREKKTKAYDVIQGVKKKLDEIINFSYPERIKPRLRRYLAHRVIEGQDSAVSERYHDDELMEREVEIDMEKLNIERETRAMHAEDRNMLFIETALGKLSRNDSWDDSMDEEYIIEKPKLD